MFLFCLLVTQKRRAQLHHTQLLLCSFYINPSNVRLARNLAANYNTKVMSKQLTHIDDDGRAHMVDIGHKPDSFRTATARGFVQMQPHTLQLILDGQVKKGDVLAIAELAGMMAAKRTSDLIPLCHPLLLSHVSVSCRPNVEQSHIVIEATVQLTGKTGVEMEALTAVTVAGLTIYDMAKAVDKEMHLTDVHLVHKKGGKSGEWWSKQP